MNVRIIAVFSAFSLAPAADTVESEFAARFFRERVEPVFARTCHECHANGKHKGGLSMADRNHLLEGGTEGVVLIPGDAKRSPLIAAIRWEGTDDELYMPPKRKLSDQEIADITRWVDMGAPWPVGGTTAALSATAAAIAPAEPAKPPLAGRMHPAVVHLPIAGLGLAAVAELLVACGLAALRPATTLLVIAGTAGALGSVISGTMLAGTEEASQALVRHQLTGWGVLVTALACCALLLPAKRWPLRLALIVATALVMVTGHLGGIMVYGEAWFR